MYANSFNMCTEYGTELNGSHLTNLSSSGNYSNKASVYTHRRIQAILQRKI